MTNELPPPKKNIGLVFGAINGGAQVLITGIFYLAGVAVFTSGWTNLAFIVPIVITVLGALQLRKQKGGVLPFGDALKTVFGIMVLGSFIGMVFDYLLLNYIDVPFRDAAMQEIAVNTERMMEKMGMAQKDIDKVTEETLNGNNFTFGKLFLGFALKCIGLFIVSLIIAVIVKRERPVFDNSFNQ